MEFENKFSVDAPIDTVWAYLLDVPSIAPCVPGTQLTEVVNDTEYKGTVKIKLGAAQISYRGTITLREVDEKVRRVVLSASGSETRGAGSVSGTVTSTLTEEPAGRTGVHIVSEVNVTGRVAQFGRNIMQDVSNRLIREFASCLQANLNSQTGGDRPPREAGETAPSSERPDPPDDTRATAVLPQSADMSRQREPVEQDSPEADDAVKTEPPVGNERVASPTRSTPAIGHGSYSEDEIRLVPLVTDVVRARMAGGLRALARLVDPEKTPRS